MKLPLFVLLAVITLQPATCSLQEDYFKLSAEDIDGKVVEFKKFKGMVSMVLNEVGSYASFCVCPGADTREG